MYVVFDDGTVHETDDLKLDHKENIAAYTAKHDNDPRQVDIGRIESFSNIYVAPVRKIDPDLVHG